MIIYVVPFFNDICSFDILVVVVRSLNGSGRVLIRRFIVHFTGGDPLLRVQEDNEPETESGACYFIGGFVCNHGRGYRLFVEGADFEGEKWILDCLLKR